MPDFSMCGNLNCTLASQCKRNIKSGTKPSDYQAWNQFTQEEDGLCDFFYGKSVIYSDATLEIELVKSKPRGSYYKKRRKKYMTPDELIAEIDKGLSTENT